MRFRFALLCSLTASVVLFGFGQSGETEPHRLSYETPIDAVSVGVPRDTIDLQVRGRGKSGWTRWYSLELEKEFDPTLRESNLVMFPEPVTALEFTGNEPEYDVHPLRVANDPIRYQTAAVSGTTGRPRILTRNEWGADASLLYASGTSSRSDEPKGEENSSTGPVSSRIVECERLQRTYPEDFRVSDTIAQDRRGRTLRWPQRYSPEVKLLVVHHTAQNLDGDVRSGVERMRALYAYHSQSRGWGDIGYHFVIDETGQVYEGRSGGRYVVGGHVYCGNIGTIGVALMGNFDQSQPTQAQAQSLQWLLSQLSNQYRVDLDEPVSFRGKEYAPIVGHGDLISTACPGYYLRETLGQIRANVQRGNVTARVDFPEPLNTRPSRVSPRTPSTSPPTSASPLRAIGSTQLTGRPGGFARISLIYQNPGKSTQARERLGIVRRSTNAIGVWQDIGNGRETAVRREVIATQALRRNTAETIRLRIQLPTEPGTYTLSIDDITYTLSVEGRRDRSVSNQAARTRFRTTRSTDTTVTPQTASRAQRVSLTRQAVTTSESASSPDTTRRTSSSSSAIRIRLSYFDPTATVRGDRTTIIGRERVTSAVYLRQEGSDCVAETNGQTVDRGVVRIDPGHGISTISSWAKATNRFRGVLECRIVDGQFTLINELSLEEYLAGLAEEPDTEPYQKQRAFAIAARSYAAHYLEPQNRKFPGKPYDGSDSAAEFQLYGGVVFEERNPRWVEAVRSTADLVVMREDTIVKTAYFSSNDGRTKSPSEIGWGSYPFADEVFFSKPDPWCTGMENRGHGVGMSGCGSEGQANEGKTAEEILTYYYPNTELRRLP